MNKFEHISLSSLEIQKEGTEAAMILPRINLDTYEEGAAKDNDQSQIQAIKEALEQNQPVNNPSSHNFQENRQPKETGLWKKMTYLWKKTEPDCYWNLIDEFLFNPAAFNNRYCEEKKFQDNLDTNWKD